MRDMIQKRGLEKKMVVASAATSSEEEGNGVHYGTRRKLAQVGIPVDFSKRARRMTKADYDKYDLLIAMESYNISNMHRITGGDPDNKMFRLLKYSSRPRDIADPWYTGNFDVTYNDIVEGCTLLLENLADV